MNLLTGIAAKEHEANVALFNADPDLAREIGALPYVCVGCGREMRVILGHDCGPPYECLLCHNARLRKRWEPAR